MNRLCLQLVPKGPFFVGDSEYGIMSKLPIGIQTFEKLCEGDYLYVDKIAFVWIIASTEIKQ